MTEALILAGANIIKAGIGPGSVCTTRKVAGVGYPQLSCIMECADAAHGLGGYVLSDGGCTCPGDVIDWSARYDKELESFADMIVRECAEICLEANDHKNILRHFGVEE